MISIVESNQQNVKIVTTSKHKAIMFETHTNITKRDSFPFLMAGQYQTDLGCHGNDANVGEYRNLY